MAVILLKSLHSQTAAVGRLPDHKAGPLSLWHWAKGQLGLVSTSSEAATSNFQMSP